MRALNAGIAVAAATALGLASVANANLLGNAGFEDPTLFDASAFDNPGNWVAFFGGPAGTFLESFNFVGAPPHSGVQALKTTITAGTNPNGYNAFTGQVQFVPGITPGIEYTYSIWARDLTGGTLNGGAEFRLEWLDSNNAIIGDQFALNTPIQDLLTSEYQQFSVAAVAPANAVALQAVIAVQSFLNDGVNPANVMVAWDDAEVVPAPAMLACLGVGGLAAARRRRR